MREKKLPLVNYGQIILYGQRTIKLIGIMMSLGMKNISRRILLICNSQILALNF